MNFDKYSDELFKAAKIKGCSDAEVTYNYGDNFTVKVLEGKVDSYSSSHSEKISVRVNYEGKCGRAYTEIDDDPENLINHAIMNAKVIENNDLYPMAYPGEYPETNNPEIKFISLTDEEKIQFALDLEKKFLSVPTVEKLENNTVGVETSVYRIKNTNGVNAKQSFSEAYAYSVPIVKDKDGFVDGCGFASGNDISIDVIVKRAMKDVERKLDASPVKSGEYKAIIENDAASNLLNAFFSLFSAESCQKKLSLFSDKIGDTVASELITIVDNPLYPGKSRSFDSEGVPSFSKTVVDKGVLVRHLHNLKTAQKENTESTSNGSGGGVSPSNFYILPGSASFEEMIDDFSGILITEVSGLHAGVNAVAGSFSCIAAGVLYEKGKPKQNINQITVAGSFEELLKNVTGVGNDLKFSFDGPVGSPSLVLKKIIVSGK